MKSFLKIVITLWILMIILANLPLIMSGIPMFSGKGTDFALNPQEELLETFMKNERIQIIFKTGEEEKRFWMVVKNGKVVNSGFGRIENPTITIYCDQDKANEIINSDDQISAIIDAINSGSVRVESNNTVISIMMKIAKVFKGFNL